jgi:hypothetical protein
MKGVRTKQHKSQMEITVFGQYPMEMTVVGQYPIC